MSAMVRVENLTKRYGDLVAVDDVSFEVDRGETFALIGPNGAGKTTTLKILLGLTRADRGRIALGPEALAPDDARARTELGYVPQRVSFPSGRTVRDVLGFFAALRDLPAAAVETALARVGLAGHASRRASELSGGYTQRLSLAQALLGDPALLVLDEPTASLDPEATWEFRTLIEQLQREGKTILLCSHLLTEVERIADRVLILVGGRRAALERVADLRLRQVRATRMLVELAAPGTAAVEALARRGVESVSVGEHAISVEGANGHGQAALEALRAERIDVRSFEVQRPTLEDVFLQVVRGEPRHD
jgi:ABC-type multidrug transport system ATPase subunit